jgi:hypothetical protein
MYVYVYTYIHTTYSRSQWQRGLRRGSAAVWLLGLWVQIPLEAWMSVFCECCVLSGRGLCDGLVPRPEEFYQMWCLKCDREASKNEAALAPKGLSSHWKKKVLLSCPALIIKKSVHFTNKYGAAPWKNPAFALLFPCFKSRSSRLILTFYMNNVKVGATINSYF